MEDSANGFLFSLLSFSPQQCYNFPVMQVYHSQTIEQVLIKLKTSLDGLSSVEAEKRLKEYGPNVLPKARERITRLKIFVSQWKSPLLLILLAAGLLSGALGEFIDMTVILFTAAVNALIGFFQEDKANRSLEQLRQIVEYKAIVMRNGIKMQIKSDEVAPGDILLVEAGDKAQADGRVIEAFDCLVNEAVLTGESEPVKKQTRQLSAEAVLAERSNMIFRGTVVADGRAKLVITATGRDTEIGKIAVLVKETGDEKTPLQIQLAKMGRAIGFIVILIAAAIFSIGLFLADGHSFLEMFETAVAVSVAAIPEGLVISLTVILAIGMQRILKRRALVRKLVAAETLGSVSVICTDKTGTLTEGKMQVTRIITSRDDLDFKELGVLNISDEARHADAFLALRIGVLCNNCLARPADENGEWQCVGNMTDMAFVYAGKKVGLDKRALDQAIGRVAEISFNSQRKYMATMHRVDHGAAIYVKGAVEKIYPFCAFYEEAGEAKKMTQQKLEWFKKREEELTGQGLRVLAVAYKTEQALKTELKAADMSGLVFVGLAALSDPIRPEVKEVIALTARAGIKTVMVTGDHRRTAQSIARSLGLPCVDGQVMDGAQLEAISDEELRRVVENVHVFARVDPTHKVRIIRAFQANGEVVAMTGDGVNDAPALKGADVGVALGSGTDVAKEISDLVLLDNNFSTIVAAVEEGRTIYQNIKKIILYLLSGSFAEVVLIGGSLIAGLPLAVLPIQILWINTIQDSFPNMALAFDSGERENMKDGPRRRGGSIIDRQMKIMIMIIAVVSSLVLFGLFLYFWRITGDIALTRTIMFVGLGVASLFYIYSVRSMRRMIWQINPFSNHYLTAAVLLGWALLLGAVYFPPLQLFLRTVGLRWEHWAVLIGFGLLNVVLIEAVKGIFLINKARIT